jgi:hypothetical protein
MPSQAALLLAILGLQGQDLNPQFVVARAREAASQLSSFHVHAEIIKIPHTLKPQSIPRRPTPLPEPEVVRATTGGRVIEDRFDRLVGRSIVAKSGRGPDGDARSALVRTLTDQEQDPTIAVRDSAEDFMWAIRPHRGGLDLMDLVANHPDVRMSKSGNLHVVEVPVESLADLSEFGARLLIDPDRSWAIVGIDLYVAVNGQERIFRRADIELKQLAAGRWLPARILQWQLPLPTDDLEEHVPTVTELDIDWDASQFGAGLSEKDVRLAALTRYETSRRPLPAGWSLVQYEPQTKASRSGSQGWFSGRIGVIITLNVLVLIGLGAWTVFRRHKVNK